MALIKCPECGKEASNETNYCINCGCNLKEKKVTKKKSKASDNKVIIHGYQETFAVNPSVKVYIDDELVTEVGKGQTISLPIDHDCTITFKCSLRSTKVKVFGDKTTEIMLSFNRGTGSLKAITNIQGDDVEANKLNSQAYDHEVEKAQNSSIFWIVIGIILLIVCIFIL